MRVFRSRFCSRAASCIFCRISREFGRSNSFSGALIDYKRDSLAKRDFWFAFLGRFAIFWQGGLSRAEGIHGSLQSIAGPAERRDLAIKDRRLVWTILGIRPSQLEQKGARRKLKVRKIRGKKFGRGWNSAAARGFLGAVYKEGLKCGKGY